MKRIGFLLLVLFSLSAKSQAQIGGDCSDARPELGSQCSITMAFCVAGPPTSTCSMLGGACCEGGVGLLSTGPITAKTFDERMMFHVLLRNGKRPLLNIPGPAEAFGLRKGDEIVSINYYRPTAQRMQNWTRRKHRALRFHVIRNGKRLVIYTR